MTERPPFPPVADAPRREFTEREQRLLDEHEYDTCEHEMGVCLSGCRPSCPPAYCISERHKGSTAPVWPCNVAAPILGFRNAAAYWQAEYEAMERYYAEQYSAAPLSTDSAPNTPTSER